MSTLRKIYVTFKLIAVMFDALRDRKLEPEEIADINKLLKDLAK